MSEAPTERVLEHLEFPCDYPIKVMGPVSAGFRELVVDLVRGHAPELDESRISFNASRTGKFISITLWIQATGEEQLKNIHADLKASGRVSMVL